jgi:urease accessory protein
MPEKDLPDVMVIDLTPLLMRSARDSVISCVELGRELGRQGLTSVVNGLRVYVPVTGARKVMESLMRTGPFQNVAHEFVPGAQVVPRLQPSDAKRLFDATVLSQPRRTAPSPGRAPV